MLHREQRENDFWSGISETWKYGKKLSSWESQDVHNWTLLLAIRGEGTIKTDDGEFKLAKYDAALLEPNLPHRYTAGLDWEIVWVHFLMPPEILKTLLWSEILPQARFMTLPATAFSKVKMELTEAHSLNLGRRRNWYYFAMALITSAVLRIDSFITGGGSGIPPWLADAMEMLDLPDKNINIESIAKKCGMSRTAFFHAFNKAVGYSPGIYREMKKMREAEQMLLWTNYTVSQISGEIGFENPFYFSLRFKKYYGSSPKFYREFCRTRQGGEVER